jgi:hypothetical protein
MKKIFLIALGLISLTSLAMAQISTRTINFNKNYLTAGIVTTWIIGDNPNSAPFFERDPDKPAVYGGSLNGVQAGLGLKYGFVLDDQGDFVIPIGFDYTDFNSSERTPVTRDWTIYVDYKVNAYSLSTGLNWFFYKFSNVNVRSYLGFLIKGNYIEHGTKTTKEHFRSNDSLYIKTERIKDDIFRLGAEITLGFEGEIYEPIFINVVAGLGCLNLLGRNDSRGNLFVAMPSANDSKKETITFYNSITFMLTYKFN